MAGATPERLGVLLGVLESTDPDLARVVAAWPALGADARRVLSALLDALLRNEH